MISLYDTARSEVVPLELRDPGKVSIYVCGPTVYGPPHLGHGRSVLVYDVLRRYLTWRGLEVTFVSNVTDIDDKIIARALNEGRESTDIAHKCEAIWWQALDRIDVLRPDHIPHATDYVEEMVALIGELIERDAAYVTSDGVYLSVETVEGYGLLAHQSLDSLQEGGGERDLVGVEKRHPADFALWKLAKDGEPWWPSPWGDGRPGWHTECVVMSLDILGDGFDLHTGGLDLTFPHHENERAQAVAWGRPFARHWMHHGFVELEGEKMSKSLGNVMNMLDLTDTYDPRAYRLLILRSHYRSPIEVTEATMVDAEAALSRLDSFTRRTAALDGKADADVLDSFRAAMDADLDTAGAVDVMFRQVREANTALDEGDEARAATAAAGAREIAEALGLRLDAGGDDVPPEIEALVNERQEARQARDFAAADAIRDQLAAEGWVIEDSADGPTARRAD
ncbi:MAG: cysteine--tRNA ligase [Actinomycetota bacterium]